MCTESEVISIVDYKMGNIKSIQNALSFLQVRHDVIDKQEKILEAEKIILPGVGSFRQAMQNIHKMNLYEPIREVALKQNTPILGICLGMQLLADFGEEDGGVNGLGLIPGSVRKFLPKDNALKIPHIGFNSVSVNGYSTLFDDLNATTDFYFVHSYHFVTNNDKDVTSYCVYGDKFVASLQKNNIFGTQFHPEKSQANGLKLLKNFIKMGE